MAPVNQKLEPNQAPSDEAAQDQGPTYDSLKGTFTTETLHLASIDDRFDAYPKEVQNMRIAFATVMDPIVRMREDSKARAAREFSLALTLLEEACMHSIKWHFTKLKQDKEG